MTIQAVVTDIEGTTTDINFVHQVLFRYAYEHLPDYVRSRGATDPIVQALLVEVSREINAPGADVETLIRALLSWIEQDRKVSALKRLQGLIWVEGYRQGHFTGHVYADACQALKAWRRRGVALYVFSSGSAQAQQLLFRYSDCGDLTSLFSGYYDTAIGAKRDRRAYQNLVVSIGLPARDILFLSDTVAELDAAQAVGLMTTRLVRDASASIDAGCAHPVATSFDRIELASF